MGRIGTVGVLLGVVLLVGCRPAAVWSPDSKQIALVSHGVLYTCSVPTSRFQQRSSAREEVAAPAWSPDGRQLAFYEARTQADGATTASLVVLDLSDESRRVLVPGVYSSTAPSRRGPGDDPPAPLIPDDAAVAWRPDGTALAFVDLARGGLQTVRPDGSDCKTLVSAGRDPSAPVWSPDGKLLAYWSVNGVEVVNAQGSETRYVWRRKLKGLDVVFRSAELPPVWTRDGRSLLITDDPSAPITANSRRVAIWRVPVFDGRPVTLSGTRTHDLGLASLCDDGEALVEITDTGLIVSAYPFSDAADVLSPDLPDVVLAALQQDKGPGPEDLPLPILSPDHRTIAVPLRLQHSLAPTLLLQPVSGGPLQKLAVPPPGDLPDAAPAGSVSRAVRG